MGENVVPRTIRYQCPDCEAEFTFMHHPSDEPPPDYCPKCGNFMGTEPIQLPSFINIKSQRTKNADKTYRDMETGSETRQQLAAEMTGLDKADFNSLKITDLKDNLKPGDIVAKLPPNPVSEMMDARKGDPNIGFVETAVGAQYGVPEGARVGDGMRTKVSEGHHSMQRVMELQGRQGTYSKSKDA